MVWRRASGEMEQATVKPAIANLALATLGPVAVVAAFVAACTLLVGCTGPAPRAAQAMPDMSYQAYLQADCLIWAPVMRLPYCREAAK